MPDPASYLNLHWQALRDSLSKRSWTRRRRREISIFQLSGLEKDLYVTKKSQAVDRGEQSRQQDNDLCEQMKFIASRSKRHSVLNSRTNKLDQAIKAANKSLANQRLSCKHAKITTKRIHSRRAQSKVCGPIHSNSHKFTTLKSIFRVSLSLLLIYFLSSHYNQHRHCATANQHQDGNNVQLETSQQAYDSSIATPLSTTETNSPTQQQAPTLSAQSQSESSPQAVTVASASGACFGGLQTFEKISMSSFENPAGFTTASGGSSAGSGTGDQANSFGSGILIQQDDQALTSECINLCRSQSNCLSFVIDYNKFECKSYATTQQELQQEFATKFQSARAATSSNSSDNYNSNESSQEAPQNGYQSGPSASASNVHFQQLLPSASSNYFEKICLDGVANRDQFSDVCGQGRLWTVERVVDSFLDGFVEKEVTNVNNKDECSKLCMFETQFVCRSADYDQHSRLCRLSKEDRRTQPQAMRYVVGSNRQYLENQCATPGPSSCVYETKKNVGIISMDALKFAQTAQDCQMKCNQELTFNCRSYSFHQQRCFLSGDDSVSLNSNLIKLPAKPGWTFGEKRCLVELCSKGIFSYEKITGFTLRSALSTSIDLMMSSSSPSASSLSLSAHMSLSSADNLQQAASQTKLRYMLPPNSSLSSLPPSSSSSLASAMMSMMMTAGAGANGGDMLASSVAYRDPLYESASSPLSHARRSRSTSNLAITEHCRHSCDLGYLNCPAFTIDYKNNRCQRLDRNSQGRHHELVARDGFAYYEKICLRVPEIMSMCQDKYWIFERVIGYELAPRLYDKLLKFVLSRRDCEEYCLEEKQFQCRSALYNDETSDCKLSQYNRRLALQEGGYYRNFNARISYLENNCVRDHNLGQKEQCYYEQTKEGPAYPTFTERIEMATAPQPAASGQASSGAADMGGEPSQSVRHQNASSPGQPHRYGSSFCEQLCNDNSMFECHSFGYYASTAQCFLSGDDSVSAGEMATTSSTGFTYYEKKCRLIEPQMGATNLSTSGPGQGTGIGTILTTTPANQNPYFQPPIHRHGPSSMGGSNNANGAPFANNNPMGEIETTTSTGGSRTTSTEPESLPPPPTVPYNYSNVYPTQPATNDQQQPSVHNNSYGGGGSRPQVSPPRQHSGPPVSSSNTTTSGYLDSDLYKCGTGHSFVYQRISGFEPIGGYQTLLLKNNDQPGIVGECSDLCKRAFECRAFVVDYKDNQCYAMLENSSVGMLSLRQAHGKDYFEGFCIANHLLLTGSNCRNKTWIVDKIVDQAVIGVQHQKLVPDLDRDECRQACFEERLFWCKSAMFDSSTNDCKLYSIDRESVPQMRLLFTKGVDFFENLCQISSSSCPYDAIERDMTIVTVTKSVQARSTFDCELACNSVISFNCRSYTYLDQYPSLPNLCLLSSDSRSTSQRGSVHEHSKTLYAERNCYYRRPRYPGGGSGGGTGGGGGIFGGHKYDTTSYSPPAPAVPPLSSPANPLDPYRFPSSTGLPHLPNKALDPLQSGGGGDRLTPPFPQLPTASMLPPRLAPEQEGVAANPYENLGPTLGQGDCEPHQFTFERTFGYDFKLAPKERAPIAPTIGIAIGCQQECLRRADKCQSFVVEYALPYQSCFLIETQAGANKKLLIKSPNSAYFEKVCLPRTGVSQDIEPSSHSPMLLPPGPPPPLGPPDSPTESMDITPSYSQEPWSPQVPNQLPYYLQQQQLVKNYPSRSCPKLWSFERFVNYNFTAPVDKLIENSLTKAHCQTQCLNEASFSCRAVTYDYANKLCRLFKNTRRTILSHFVDLESSAPTPSQQLANSNGLPDSHPGTAHVLIGGGGDNANNGESIQTSASSQSVANSITGPGSGPDQSKRQTGARQLPSLAPGGQPTAEASNPSKNIDYMENTCTPEPSSCQYRQIYDQYSPYIDKVNHAISLSDCQRQCDQERLFSCKSVNYDPISRNCMLVNEDLISLNRGQQNSLLPRKHAIYSEKGNCEMISVQCNSQEMLVSINFDAPFRGRVMAKGNPEQCYLLGDGQTSLQFSIVFGPKCNSRQEGHNTFVNEIVIQQHPVIMTDSDKTVRVMCAFEAPDQTITLKNPTSRDNKTGIDVGTPDMSRTRHDKQQFNSVVSNKAAPPSVVLRILDPQGRDASMINLGDNLMLKIQMQMDGMKSSALGILARNLAARSSNGESLLLIDNEGCPVDPQVFPALSIDQKDGRSLQSTFKAFRFPSSGLVNFEVQIRFCPERCQPVDCTRSGQKMHSYGRRRRRKRGTEEDGNFALDSQRAPIIQSLPTEEHQGPVTSSRPFAAPLPPAATSLDSLSTVMKPGKAFEYIRKLMLPVPTSGESTNTPDVETQQTSLNDASRAPSGQYVPEPVMGPSDANSPETNSAKTSAENIDNYGPKQLPPSNEFNQHQQQTSGEEFDNHSLTVDNDNTANNGQYPIKQTSESTIASDGQGAPPLSGGSNHFMMLNGEESSGKVPTVTGGSQEQSILMQVDEKVVPASDFTITRGLNVHPQNMAPYGRFPATGIETLTRDRSPSIMATQQVSSQSSDVAPSDQTPIKSSEPDANAGHEHDSSNNNNSNEQIGMMPSSVMNDQVATREAGGSQRAVAAANGDRHQSSATGSKDMPLRFSILVGENQAPAANGLVAVDQPSVLIMNSTRTDMDHIVIPGKKGQLDDMSDQTSTVTESIITSTHLPTHSTSYEDSSSSFLDGTIRNRHQGEPSKRNASYEQTFDALPSNSISSEIHLNHQHQQHQLHEHQRQRQHQNNPMGSVQSRNTQQNVPPLSESAASHDCQIESGKSRLRAIIWTGGIVIALNVCLVILSLVMYFRKVRLRHNHMIDRSVFDCGTQRSSDGDRWPSVILKSKNKLGTSLNAHEHFFCKLNSKPNGTGGGLEQDFNWPNLSSSSSRSTVSSLASPLPSTSIRINQMRPSLKSSAFDAHSSLRNGNFNTGLHKPQQSSPMAEESDQRDEFNARYSNNIDILSSDRF